MDTPKNIIYGYQDPRNGHLRYVGKSSNGLRRPNDFGRHYAHCQNWIQSLKKESLTPNIVIIEELSNDATEIDLNEAECHHIAYWKFLGCDLTNLTVGGEGASGRKLTEEHKAKIGLANKGRKLSEEQKARLASFSIGRKITEETRARLRAATAGENNPNFGKKNSAETSAKQSAIRKGRIPWNKGRTLSAEHVANLSKGRKGKPWTPERRARHEAKKLLKAQQAVEEK